MEKEMIGLSPGEKAIATQLKEWYTHKMRPEIAKTMDNPKVVKEIVNNALDRIEKHIIREEDHMLWTGSYAAYNNPQLGIGVAPMKVYRVRKLLHILQTGRSDPGFYHASCDHISCINPDHVKIAQRYKAGNATGLMERQSELSIADLIKRLKTLPEQAIVYISVNGRPKAVSKISLRPVEMPEGSKSLTWGEDEDGQVVAYIG